MKPMYLSLGAVSVGLLALTACGKDPCEFGPNAECSCDDFYEGVAPDFDDDPACACEMAYPDEDVTFEEDSECFCEFDSAAFECNIVYFEADFVIADGSFGYDATTGETVQVSDPLGNTYNPLVSVIFASDGYDPEDDQSYCFITFEWDNTTSGLTNASWVGSANGATDVWHGINFNPASGNLPVMTTNCGDFYWDPSVWGEDSSDDTGLLGMDPSMRDIVGGAAWGIGVGPMDSQVGTALQQAVEQQVGADAWTNDWAPYVYGSGWYWGAANQYINANFGTALGLKEDFSIDWVDTNENDTIDQGEEFILIENTDMATALPTGLYSSNGFFGVDAYCFSDEGYRPR